MLSRGNISFAARKYLTVNRATLWAAGRLAQNKWTNNILDRAGKFIKEDHGHKIDSIRSFIKLLTFDLTPGAREHIKIQLFPKYDIRGLRTMAKLGLTPKQARMRYEALILLRAERIQEFNKRFRKKTHMLNLAFADLSGLILMEKIPLRDLNAKTPKGINLSGANLYGANLSRTVLNSALLSRADLKDANLGGAWLRGAVLNKADLRGADLSRIVAENAKFKSADLREAELLEANLTGANLTDALFNGSNLDGASFKDADTMRTAFGGVDLRETNVTTAQLLTAYHEFALGFPDHVNEQELALPGRAGA